MSAIKPNRSLMVKRDSGNGRASYLVTVTGPFNWFLVLRKPARGTPLGIITPNLNQYNHYTGTSEIGNHDVA
jgi:hypothetical protein